MSNLSSDYSSKQRKQSGAKRRLSLSKRINSSNYSSKTHRCGWNNRKECMSRWSSAQALLNSLSSNRHQMFQDQSLTPHNQLWLKSQKKSSKLCKNKHMRKKNSSTSRLRSSEAKSLTCKSNLSHHCWKIRTANGRSRICRINMMIKLNSSHKKSIN